MKRIPWLFFLALLASCVTNKKVQYLQKNDVNAKDKFKKDSVYREYDIADKQYKVQPEDLISIRIESITPEEFDILNRPGVTNSGIQAGQANQSGQGNFLLLAELVNNRGEIPFLLSGQVKVVGMTVYQIQDSLQKVANLYLKSPIVRARLLNYRFTVLGEVVKEGLITVGNNRVSVLEAIGLAGGLGELADRANIKLIRQYNGKAEVYYINVLDENLFNSPVYYTQQNDIIVVPPLRQRTFRKYFSQNLAIFLTSASIFLLTLNLLKP